MSLSSIKRVGMPFLVLFMLCIAVPLQAKVSVEEAEQLKKNLTPTGAERAGNAEGTIPAWDGGLTATPDSVKGWKPESTGGRYPDPFADEKPLFSITAKNADEYADKLSPGTLAMLKKYPDTYRLDIYPTHRTFAGPQWVYDATYKNAIEAEKVQKGNHFGTRGAVIGSPFPIPKEGPEVIFNSFATWKGGDLTQLENSGVVQADGRWTPGGVSVVEIGFPYHDKNATPESWNGYMTTFLLLYSDPPRRKGEIILSNSPMDYTVLDKGTWQYLPGQRRVRRAPSIAYDTPNPTFGGYAVYDEAYMFNGQLDRFDWKLVGKQEMFIPYSTYRQDAASRQDLLTKQHMNPDHVRWELHRVWAVEATIREGSRHCYGKRVFYVDEDSWQITIHDKYDTRGNLWRTQIAGTYQRYDVPGYCLRSYTMYDLQSDAYAYSGGNSVDGMVLFSSDLPEDRFTPDSVRKLGRR